MRGRFSRVSPPVPPSRCPASLSLLLTSSAPRAAGPSYVLASLVPNRAESVPLDVVFSEDVRISARVVTAAAAASSRRYAVHLTGDVNDAMFDFGEDEGEGDASSEDASEEEDVPAREATRATGEDDDRGGSSSSESWGSDAEAEDEDARVELGDAAAKAKASSHVSHGDTERDALARVAAARAGAATNRWVDPIEDAGGLRSARGAKAARRWDAPGAEDDEKTKTSWAYHLQTAGARHHRRSTSAPKFAWTGSLRPHLVSPRRSVPSLTTGWLCPLPDYAATGWPEEEFNSRWQRKLEVKSDAAMAKMRAACRLGRHVMDTVARAIEPGVTTDLLDRICHVVTVSNGAYPSPRNYMGFPKSLCTSVNETVCHGIPDARPLLDGDIVNLDVTVCLNGYHGDLNETYFVEATEEERDEDAKTRSEREALKARSVALMRCARECLADAIALCAPGTRFRDLGEAIQARADRSGFGVVRDFCGHGIGTLFHCAPNVPHYARNKAAGAMAPGMTFTIEPMVNEGSRKCVTWPDGWTAVTADGGRSAQYEHTLAVTETGVEILTERTENSRPLW